MKPLFQRLSNKEMERRIIELESKVNELERDLKDARQLLLSGQMKDIIKAGEILDNWIKRLRP